jgi:hypothetical protein
VAWLSHVIFVIQKKRNREIMPTQDKSKMKDVQFKREVDRISRCKNRDELMPVFLNERMEIDPNQVFRVLQLSSPVTSAVSK